MIRRAVLKNFGRCAIELAFIPGVQDSFRELSGQLARKTFDDLSRMSCTFPQTFSFHRRPSVEPGLQSPGARRCGDGGGCGGAGLTIAGVYGPNCPARGRVGCGIGPNWRAAINSMS